VKLFDKSNALIGFYPATAGSQEKPSPSGTLKVTEIDRNPTYRYNPTIDFLGETLFEGECLFESTAMLHRKTSWFTGPNRWCEF
jgi:hypothetical protein